MTIYLDMYFVRFKKGILVTLAIFNTQPKSHRISNDVLASSLAYSILTTLAFTVQLPLPMPPISPWPLSNPLQILPL